MSQVKEGGKGLPGRGNRVGQSQRYDAWLVQEPGAIGHEQRARRSTGRGGRGGWQEMEAWCQPCWAPSVSGGSPVTSAF